MCFCDCPYGTFPSCRRVRGHKPCYLEDASYAADMDDNHFDAGSPRACVRLILPRHEGRPRKLADCLEDAAEGFAWNYPPLPETYQNWLRA